MNVIVASLENDFPTEFRATHRYFGTCFLIPWNTRASDETLPFWTTVSFETVELFSNQLIRGRGNPSTAHIRVTMATPLVRYRVVLWGCIVKIGFHSTKNMKRQYL